MVLNQSSSENYRVKCDNTRKIKTVWQVMRQTANDNTPPFTFWFKRIFTMSVAFFALIYLIMIGY